MCPTGLNSIQTVQVREDKRVSLEYLFDSLDFLFVWKAVMSKYHLHGKPYNPVAIFKALLLKEMRQISSKRKLAMFLKRNPFWLRKCGFERPPHHDTFSKFIDRVRSESFEHIFDCLVKRIGEVRNIGRIVAVDSTLIKAYSRSYKNSQPSDPDAEWGYDPNNEGWVFGYKLHLAVDAELELPLAFTVTPANVYDSVEYPNLPQKLLSKGIKPEIIIADAGYDAKKNYLITLAEDIIPIIALNPRNLKHEEKRDWERSYRYKETASSGTNSTKREEAMLDTLARYSFHGSYSASKGGAPEQIIREILDKMGVRYDRGKVEAVGRRMDFIIPSKSNPKVFIQCSYVETTSSGMGDKAKTERDTVAKKH